MQDTHDPRLVAEYADQLLDEQIDTGRAPNRPEAWLAATRRDIAQRHSPEYVARAVAGFRARAQGRKLTGWREVRGTHGIDHVADPFGTDRPPW